ncbi:MAG: manganese/iron transport system permease protein [Acidimicrobiaceae bacterium]|nr:MAG: manganese/iron transport system permease protein [Acidimicrobiaceae bacterium]
MLRALGAGVLVAVLCAVAGTFVVLRGLAFIGDALAHGVLPGVAGALLLGAPGIVGAAVGSAVMIVGVSMITSHTRLSSDTAIGLLFVGMLALGVIIVSRSDSFNGDIIRILFGEILGIDRGDLIVLVAAAITISSAAVLLARPFLLLCLDPEQADVSGFRSSRYHLVMLVMVAATVVVSFQAVGTLLVFGMLIAPAGAGALLARRVPAMMAWALGLGIVSVYLGLLISYHYDLAAGATIVLVTVCIFFVVLVTQAIRTSRSPQPGAPQPGAGAVGR